MTMRLLLVGVVLGIFLSGCEFMDFSPKGGWPEAQAEAASPPTLHAPEYYDFDQTRRIQQI